jgi:sec-independent protein translocase protein TatA
VELFSPGHLIVLLVIAGFIFFGWKQLPEMARSVGKSLHIFKAEMTGEDEKAKAEQANGTMNSVAAATMPSTDPAVPTAIAPPVAPVPPVAAVEPVVVEPVAAPTVAPVPAPPVAAQPAPVTPPVAPAVAEQPPSAPAPTAPSADQIA